MTTRSTGLVATLCVLGFLATPPIHGQSLSEAAAKERERRRKAASAEPTAKPSPATDAKSAPATTTATATEFHSESWWRSKSRAAREAIADAEAQVKYYEARIEETRTGIRPPTPGDASSPAPPARIATEAEKRDAEASLAQAQRQLATARKHMEELEEQARREQVPPAWLQ